MDGYDRLCQWLTGEQIPWEKQENSLVIVLGERVDEQPQIMEVVIENVEQFQRIDFQMEMMRLSNSDSISDVRSFFSFVNRMSKLPGFYMHEVDDTIYYRYAWIGQNMDQQLFLFLLEQFQDSYQTYQSLFHEVAQGQLTFHEAVSNL